MNGTVAQPGTHLSRRLQVLFVSMSPQVWGAERSLLGLAPLLSERGLALTLASPSGPFAEAWTALGLPHVGFDAPSRLGLRSADDGRPGLGALGREVATTGRSARRL